MDTTLTPIVCTLLGLLLGSILTKRRDMEQEIRKMKAELYSTFIKANAKLSFEDTNLGDPKHIMDYQIICEQMCVCASSNILNKIALMHRKSEKNKKYFDSQEGKDVYMDIIFTMRSETNNQTKNMNFDTIKNIIWK